MKACAVCPVIFFSLSEGVRPVFSRGMHPLKRSRHSAAAVRVWSLLFRTRPPAERTLSRVCFAAEFSLLFFILSSHPQRQPFQAAGSNGCGLSAFLSGSGVLPAFGSLPSISIILGILFSVFVLMLFSEILIWRKIDRRSLLFLPFEVHAQFLSIYAIFRLYRNLYVFSHRKD